MKDLDDPPPCPEDVPCFLLAEVRLKDGAVQTYNFKSGKRLTSDAFKFALFSRRWSILGVRLNFEGIVESFEKACMLLEMQGYSIAEFSRAELMSLADYMHFNDIQFGKTWKVVDLSEKLKADGH